MDHKIAMETYAAERYLLGELRGKEQEEYEDHFFNCPTCAEEVRVAAAFVNHARAELIRRDRRGPVPKSSRAFPAQPLSKPAPSPRSVTWGRNDGWMSWLRPAPALGMAAMFLAVLGVAIYQNLVVIPGLKKPEVLSAAFVLKEVRGLEIQVTTAEGRPFRLEFDIPPQEAGTYKEYKGTILTENAKPKMTFTVSVDKVKDSISVLFPADALKEGKYSLVIRGVNSDGTEDVRIKPVAQYSFSLQFSK
ncbi:MAG TPA: hypothetical protein VKZ53_06980 [Candidatus Angelobacter sp.]|nr:hypothetical protein [Candidatus Angelobacter sp.]